MTDETKKERKPRVKGAPKSKEERRKAWRDFYKKNRLKYHAWAAGWRSGSKLTYQEFLAKRAADREAEKAAAKEKAKAPKA